MRRNIQRVVDDALGDMVGAFASVDDPAVMRKLFNEVFTSSERRDIALRWELMKMIQQDVPQREIAARLGISLCKITRGSRVLRSRGSASARIMARGTDAVDSVGVDE